MGWWKENLPVELLDLTVSCFSKTRGHCGKCQACLRKALAYTFNGLKLKTDIDVRIGCVKFIEKYQKLMTRAIEKQDFRHYSQRRCEQDLAAIKSLLKQS